MESNFQKYIDKIITMPKSISILSDILSKQCKYNLNCKNGCQTKKLIISKFCKVRINQYLKIKNRNLKQDNKKKSTVQSKIEKMDHT